MLTVCIRHRTTYRYRNPVAFGEHRIMLRPAEGFDQRLLSFELSVSPTPALVRDIHDLTGASLSVARFRDRSAELSIESRAEVEHRPNRGLDLESSGTSLGAEPFAYDEEEAPALREALRIHHRDGGELSAWVRRFLKPVGRTRLSTILSDMTHAIRSDLGYELRLEGGPQSPELTLSRRRGSCRDFAVLQIEAARQLGLAAQFVTGYVYSGSAKQSGPGHGHTHAWARIYVPACGWVDFDPTNGIIGNANLIRVAAAAESRLVVPLHGAWRGLRSDFLSMDVEVDIGVTGEVLSQPGQSLRVAQVG
jgi:transglutaminase-like putative cysteine protease